MCVYRYIIGVVLYRIYSTGNNSIKAGFSFMVEFSVSNKDHPQQPPTQGTLLTTTI